MLKNVITIVLSLCLIFIISVMTVNAAGETQRGVPQNRMPSMDENPSGNFALSEEFTPQEGEFTLPESEENNSSETAAPKTATGVTEENQNAPENNKASGRTQNSPFSGGMPEGMGGFSGNTQSGQNSDAQ